MRGFEPVTLSWAGADFIVPAEGQLMLVAAIEEALEGRSGQRAVNILLQSPSYSKLSMAYGAALRHAGASVTDEEIYLSIMEDFTGGGHDVVIKVQGAVMGLLAIVAPPIALSLREAEPEKKPEPAEKKAS